MPRQASSLESKEKSANSLMEKKFSVYTVKLWFYKQISKSLRWWRSKRSRKRPSSWHGIKLRCKLEDSLITATVVQNGRIIKNLQPISMGVWRRLPVKIYQLRLIKSRQSLLTLNAYEDREKWNRKRFLFNFVFMSFFLCSHTGSGKLLQWLN